MPLWIDSSCLQSAVKGLVCSYYSSSHFSFHHILQNFFVIHLTHYNWVLVLSSRGDQELSRLVGVDGVTHLGHFEIDITILSQMYVDLCSI